MSDSLSTFERLVLTLGSSERQDMLRQLAESGEQKEDADVVSAGEGLPPAREILYSETRLQEESFLVRFWFSVVAFFSSITPTQAYARHLVSELGRDLSRNHGSFVDTTRRIYTETFLNEILKLKKAQEFFLQLLASYESDKGGFYLVIASLLIKDTDSAVAAAADPFIHPFDEDPKKDLRVSMTRAMDSAMSAMLESDRGKMYQAAGAIEWMKSFCNLPLDRIILRFGMIPGVSQSCSIDAISNEMQSLSNTLASGKRISVLLLEALFLFSVQNRLAEDKFDLETACREFVDKSVLFLSDIRNFKDRIPLPDFIRFTEGDVSWQPDIRGEGEDWFVLYRGAWKTRFDARWTEWNRLHRKAMLEKNACSFLGVSELPSLAYHPWEGLWIPLTLRREISVCFMKGLFSAVYPQAWMKPLKILLIDGDFYKRENLVEFTDAFSTLEHMRQVIETFEIRCSPKGDIGEGFALVQGERLATITGKARIDNLMLTLNSDAEQIVSLSVSAFRSVDAVLSGILAATRGGPYDTLLNLSTIQGKLNERYRRELSNVLQSVKDACAILADAEVVEKDAL